MVGGAGGEEGGGKKNFEGKDERYHGNWEGSTAQNIEEFLYTHSWIRKNMREAVKTVAKK